jgi:hypothetical protein
MVLSGLLSDAEIDTVLARTQAKVAELAVKRDAIAEKKAKSKNLAKYEEAIAQGDEVELDSDMSL